MTVPAFGLGTFRLKDQTVIDSVRNALEVGYRAIDTAQIYGNEAEVGQAIAESGVARDQLFLTTKIWVDNYAADKLIPSLRDSLAKLRTDYVDLLLIHWPAPGNGVELREYMTALADAKAQGLTRQIGVSNFNIELTRQAIEVVGASEIATNQIELSPYLQNPALTAFLQDQGITVTSYMTLAYGKVLKDPVLAAIAGKHQATCSPRTCAWMPMTWPRSPRLTATAATSIRRAWPRPGTEAPGHGQCDDPVAGRWFQHRHRSTAGQ